jgi:hypothetical protein
MSGAVELVAARLVDVSGSDFSLAAVRPVAKDRLGVFNRSPVFVPSVGLQSARRQGHSRTTIGGSGSWKPDSENSGDRA